MWFSLGNTNIRYTYGLLMSVFDIKVDIDKEAGLDTYLIKIDNINQLVELHNICKRYNPYFKGIIFKDGVLIIDDGTQLREVE